jgi:hypothetical protein
MGAISLIALAICSQLFAQDLPVQEPADLQVELRSATGSNRFQLGEVIPLEVLISSGTPNRYLEPCKMFWESCFGYPQCRFVTDWSFEVTPDVRSRKGRGRFCPVSQTVPLRHGQCGDRA